MYYIKNIKTTTKTGKASSKILGFSEGVRVVTDVEVECPGKGSTWYKFEEFLTFAQANWKSIVNPGGTQGEHTMWMQFIVSLKAINLKSDGQDGLFLEHVNLNKAERVGALNYMFPVFQNLNFKGRFR